MNFPNKDKSLSNPTDLGELYLQIIHQALLDMKTANSAYNAASGLAAEGKYYNLYKNATKVYNRACAALGAHVYMNALEKHQ